MNWKRAGYDVMTLHAEDGTYAGYFVVRHKTSHGPYYVGWKGNHMDRDIREHVDSGWSKDGVFRSCEIRWNKDNAETIHT